MKLENQYCSREQAIKLKELGVLNSVTHKTEPDKDGDIYDTATVGTYYSCIVGDTIITGIIGEQEDAPYKNYNPFKHYSVAELGVMIPEWHFTYPRLDGFASYKNEDGFFAVADGTINGKNYSTEAECRAALVIYLIENNILSVKTCNERLLA